MAKVILHPNHPDYCKECIFHGKNSECLSKDYIEHSYKAVCVWGYCKFKKIKKSRIGRMERLTDKNFRIGFDDSDKLPSYIAVYERLKHYEDLEEQGRLLELPCKSGDIVYDVVLCNDGKYHVFEMKVCNINPFGDVRGTKAWNVYLEGSYIKAYRSFYDFEKTVFLTRQEAETKLAEMAQI